MNTDPLLSNRHLVEQVAESARPRHGRGAAHEGVRREQSAAGYIGREEVQALQRFAGRYGVLLEDFGPGLASLPYLKGLQAARVKFPKQSTAAYGGRGPGRRSDALNMAGGPGDGVAGNHGGSNMSQDVFSSQWKEIRGHVKQWWGELTDEDLEEISGNRERLAGIIQKRYGRTREEAEVDINRFLIRVTSLLKLDRQRDAGSSS